MCSVLLEFFAVFSVVLILVFVWCCGVFGSVLLIFCVLFLWCVLFCAVLFCCVLFGFVFSCILLYLAPFEEARSNGVRWFDLPFTTSLSLSLTLSAQGYCCRSPLTPTTTMSSDLLSVASAASGASRLFLVKLDRFGVAEQPAGLATAAKANQNRAIHQSQA